MAHLKKHLSLLQIVKQFCEGAADEMKKSDWCRSRRGNSHRRFQCHVTDLGEARLAPDYIFAIRYLYKTIHYSHDSNVREKEMASAAPVVEHSAYWEAVQQFILVLRQRVLRFGQVAMS